MFPVLFLEGKTEGELPRVAMNSAIIGCESSSSLVSAGRGSRRGGKQGGELEGAALPPDPFLSDGSGSPSLAPPGPVTSSRPHNRHGTLSCEPQRSRWRGEEMEGGAAFPDTALAAAVCFRCITRWSLERRP